MRLKFFTILFVMLMIINAAHAQLCQGSLGDPIINTSFGSGSNPGPSLAAATTSYQYIAYDCPGDGFYTVRNSTTACFGHTGEPGGYFMLVNASYQPGAFYLDTVKGLCGNSTYEFAAWIMNVLLPVACSGAGNQPNLTFSIEKTDGTPLQSYNSGNIPATANPIWKQYGFFFTTPPAGSDIVLRIINNAPGGCGNDLALDDITFRPCGPMLTPAIAGMPTTSVSLCEGTAGSFTFTCSVSGGFNNPTFQWQERFNGGSWSDLPGQTATMLPMNFSAATALGNYEFRLAVAEAGNMGSLQCRIVSQPLSVRINAHPVTTASNNGPVCERSTLLFTATGGSQYAWSGPNGYTGSGSPLPLVNIQLNQAGKYYVTVTSAAGCVHTDSTIIVVNPGPLATTAFANASICKADSIQLTAGGGPPYQWIPSAGLSNANVYDPKASPALTTVYSVIVTNQLFCRDTATITINVVGEPVVNAGPDAVMLKGQSLQLSGTVSGNGNTYAWSPATYISNIYSLQPVIDPPADARYILKAVSGCGTSSDTMFVKVYNDIFIPNAFSPNADGVNDTWNIPALGAYPGFELFIFNRYGQLIFQTKNTPIAWDGTYKGKPCVNGVYTYLLNTGNNKEMIKGTVMIIR
jgi:gliding motility-associated-like protein